MPVTIERCNTPEDLLHRLVREGLPELLSTLSMADRYLPRHVEQELANFIGCGDPREGFAWLMCDGCSHHRLVPFSCKGRGFCPCCGGRRMAERARRWVGELIPDVRIRQWVFTVPWPRRWLLARKPSLAKALLAIALQEIRGWMRRRTGEPRGETGTITVIQRFGSALNLNVHFHVLMLDGVYTEGCVGGELEWHRAPTPRTSEVEELVVAIALRCERYLGEQGYGRDEADGEEADGQSSMQAAAVSGRSAVGGGRRARRVQLLGGRPYRLPARCALCDGYSLHGGVSVNSSDRLGLERLCRYVSRRALAKARLREVSAGRVQVSFKRPWSDGTVGVEFSRVELVERLAALVPPRGSNTVLYHGVLSARSRFRSRVPGPSAGPSLVEPAGGLSGRLTRRPVGRSRWVSWRRLLWRVFAVDGFACPRCGEGMRVRGVVLPPATLTVLSGLARSARGPPGGFAARQGP